MMGQRTVASMGIQDFGRRGRLVLHLLASAAFVSLALHAVPAAAQQAVFYAIPAGSLDSALTRFGAASGVQVLYSSAITSGLKTKGASGTLGPQAALGRLLDGTGLTYRFTGPASVTISSPNETASTSNVPGATPLQPIIVRAEGATTEGSNSYNATAVTVAGKIAVPVREVPNSVTVITRKQIEDQNLNSVDAILRQTPGVTAVNYGDGTYYFNARGFSLDSQYDGMPVTGGIQYLPQFDSSIYDRVEVLKGPAGILQGSGSGPAGTANFVRRAASDTYSLTTDTQIGSWDFYRGTVDLTGPLNTDGSARGRVIVTGQDRDFFYDDGHERHGTIYGNVAFDVTDDTTVTLSGAYERQKLAPFDYGQSLYSNGDFLDVSRSDFFGAPWNSSTNHIAEGYANVVHRFDDDWVWNTTATYRDFGGPSRYAYMDDLVDPATNLADYALQSQEISQQWFGFDTNLTGSYELFGREHKLLIGANYSHIAAENRSGYAPGGLIDIFDTDSIPDIDIPFDYGTKTRSQQWGIYGQTRLSITDPLTVVLGGRVSWYRSENQSLYPTVGDWVDDPSVNGKFSPYLGIVYDLTDDLSVYASYADIFTPQTQLSYTSGGLPPRVGEQYEVGIKGDFFDGGLSATLAAFEIRDKNRAISDPDPLHPPGSYIAAGEAKSRGIELTVSGEVTPNWSVMGGYTYLYTEYQDANLDPEEPRHTFKLWNKYTFDNEALAGFSLGGGARIVSETQRGTTKQGGYAVFDAQIGYKINEHADFTITAKNVFDRKYFDRLPTYFFGQYGEPRSIMADLKVKW